jgi:hypothetical protein
MSQRLEFTMTNQYPYPNENVKETCLIHIRETNRQLELYNIFLDEAIAQIDSELLQKKRDRLQMKEFR